MYKYNDEIEKIGYFYNYVGPKYNFIYPDYMDIEYNLARSIMNTLLIKNKSSILDLGCGAGQLLEEIRKIDNQKILVGCDISSQNIKNARKISKKNGSKIKYLNEDMLKLKRRDIGEFDLIMCLGNTITHFPELVQSKFYSNICKLLKPRGYLLIDTYKNWKDYFKKQSIFEPKGVIRKGNKLTFSFINSVCTKSSVERNIYFVSYRLNESKMPKTIDKISIKQYPFLLEKENYETNCCEVTSDIKLNDKLNIYKYYMLRKKI